MEFLNDHATSVFIKLMEYLVDKDHHKIINEPYMPLVIERIGRYISTPYGLADQYSLCHYFKQNGDLMQDPEMCFLAIEHWECMEGTKYKFAPYLFQQASSGIYQESVQIENSVVTELNRNMQREHTLFANLWLSNIHQQGF